MRVCPSCGYCEACGRAGPCRCAPWPWAVRPPWPVYPRPFTADPLPRFFGAGSAVARARAELAR